jgi:hypothetical protein
VEAEPFYADAYTKLAAAKAAKLANINQKVSL